MNRRTLVALSLLVGCFPFASSQAQTATDYPNRPVKIIVPFPAGGTSDIMGRLIAEGLSKQLKQPFVVDNKAGAGGAIGSDQVAKAAPDGYTLPAVGHRQQCHHPWLLHAQAELRLDQGPGARLATRCRTERAGGEPAVSKQRTSRSSWLG